MAFVTQAQLQSISLFCKLHQPNRDGLLNYFLMTNKINKKFIFYKKTNICSRLPILEYKYLWVCSKNLPQICLGFCMPGPPREFFVFCFFILYQPNKWWTSLLFPFMVRKTKSIKKKKSNTIFVDSFILAVVSSWTKSI